MNNQLFHNELTHFEILQFFIYVYKVIHFEKFENFSHTFTSSLT